MCLSSSAGFRLLVPINRFWPNLTGRKYLIPSTKLCFWADLSTKMKVLVSVWLTQFNLLCNCKIDLMKLDRKKVINTLYQTMIYMQFGTSKCGCFRFQSKMKFILIYFDGSQMHNIRPFVPLVTFSSNFYQAIDLISEKFLVVYCFALLLNFNTGTLFK